MISPLEKMRVGIETNDMDLIRVAFEELTGEVTTGPKNSPTTEVPPMNKNDFSDFVASAQSSDPTTKSRVAKTAPVVGGDNTFTDEGTDSKDIETPQIALSPRNRPASVTVEILCHKCGKTEKVAQSLVQGEFHVCGKCARK